MWAQLSPSPVWSASPAIGLNYFPEWFPALDVEPHLVSRHDHHLRMRHRNATLTAYSAGAAFRTSTGQQPLDEIDTVTRLRHDRALMPSEYVSPGALPEACPPRYPWRPYPTSSFGACPAPVLEARCHASLCRCRAGGTAACARRACTTQARRVCWRVRPLKPSTSLCCLPLGSSSLLTYGTHHGRIGPFQIFLFRHLNVP